MVDAGYETETKRLRCPYCLRLRDTETAYLDWCMGVCEEMGRERQATGFVEADEVVNGGGEAFA